MIKKQLVVICISLILFSGSLYAEEVKKESVLELIVEKIAEDEMRQAHEDLLAWTDSNMIEELSKITVSDQYIKELFSEFKNTIVNPLDPNTDGVYNMPNAEDSLIKVTQLGRKIHNLGLAVSDTDMEKYGNLLQAMRDVLYIDSKHIPLAIKHDNSRDVYWYELHNGWVKEAESIFNELLGKN